MNACWEPINVQYVEAFMRWLEDTFANKFMLHIVCLHLIPCSTPKHCRTDESFRLEFNLQWSCRFLLPDEYFMKPINLSASSFLYCNQNKIGLAIAMMKMSKKSLCSLIISIDFCCIIASEKNNNNNMFFYLCPFFGSLSPSSIVFMAITKKIIRNHRIETMTKMHRHFRHHFPFNALQLLFVCRPIAVAYCCFCLSHSHILVVANFRSFYFISFLASSIFLISLLNRSKWVR